ncbi:hypothetical protein HELRODRAFT_178125 [Helobdella robusta]|uniref:G-protein coupled receptors family 1 profile domain-containing protein n=1 Tax=Helobdella robusta TaxID=6412 RepID=T1FCS5_HELRO|nr:hypothetical protein HELRODRAFT_178125 [Helobdella robusta]ESN97339.1 hypothetical protein HELRODRAFT_178125 [Helobdella robusta]
MANDTPPTYTDDYFLQTETSPDRECRFFLLVVYVFIFGGLTFIGLIGNLISFYVLRMDKKSHVACFLLQSLAMNDTLFLLLTSYAQVFTSLVYYFGREDHAMMSYNRVFVFPFVHATQMATVWITVLISFNRYIAICWPFHEARWNTNRNVKIQITVMAILVMIYCLPKFFESEIVYQRENVTLIEDYLRSNQTLNASVSVVETFVVTTEFSAMKKNTFWYGTIYETLLYCLFVYLGPLLLLIFFKSQLIKELIKSNKRLKQLKISKKRKCKQAGAKNQKKEKHADTSKTLLTSCRDREEDSCPTDKNEQINPTTTNGSNDKWKHNVPQAHFNNLNMNLPAGDRSSDDLNGISICASTFVSVSNEEKKIDLTPVKENKPITSLPIKPIASFEMNNTSKHKKCVTVDDGPNECASNLIANIPTTDVLTQFRDEKISFSSSTPNLPLEKNDVKTSFDSKSTSQHFTPENLNSDSPFCSSQPADKHTTSERASPQTAEPTTSTTTPQTTSTTLQTTTNTPQITTAAAATSDNKVKRSQTYAPPPGQNFEMNDGDQNITKVMVGIVVVFILCQTPGYINSILNYCNPDYKCGNAYFYYYHLSNLAISTNSVVNFIIYCVFRKQFREKCVRIFCARNYRYKQIRFAN